jgi:hypothetical protein
VVGFAGALGQVFDLIIFDRNFAAKKGDFAVFFF